MGFSVLADIKPHMRAYELEVCMVDVAQAVLVVGFAHAEDAEIGKKRNNAVGGKSPCHGSGIMLLNAHLEEMVGLHRLKPVDLDGGGKVAVKNSNGACAGKVLVCLGNAFQGAAEGGAVVGLGVGGIDNGLAGLNSDRA